jgi:hypothetical protein
MCKQAVALSDQPGSSSSAQWTQNPNGEDLPDYAPARVKAWQIQKNS